MTARYRKISPRIWNDEIFRKMSMGEKLGWLALLTHPAMTPMGAGVFPGQLLDDALDLDVGHACVCPCCHSETNGDERKTIGGGIPTTTGDGYLDRFEKAGMILRDGGLVIVKKYLLYNAPDNANHLAGWIESCEELPRSDQFQVLRDHMESIGDLPNWLFDGLLNPLAEQQHRGLRAKLWDRVKKPKQEKSKSPPNDAPRGGSGGACGDGIGDDPPDPGTGTGAVTGAVTGSVTGSGTVVKDLLDRYEGNDLIEKALTSIASTRKSNKISASVRQGILAKWNKCSVEAVMAGCKTYLESNYASTGKDEKYLWGIIRGKEREIASAPVNTVEIDPEIVEVLTRLRNAHAKDGGYEIHGEVTQNMTSARIALVLDKYGEDGCLQIQRGHIAKGGNDFTSWPGAYPHVAGNASEPNWDWIAGFHKVGGKKEVSYQPGYGP